MATSTASAEAFRRVEPALLETLRQRKRMWKQIAIVCIVCAAGMALLTYFSDDIKLRNLGLFGGGIGGFIGLCFFAASLGDVRNAPVLKTLRDHANEIVWLYIQNVSGQTPSTYLMIALEDGNFVRFPTEYGKGEPLLALIEPMVPQATVGFSPQLHAKFLGAPRSLRRQAA